MFWFPFYLLLSVLSVALRRLQRGPLRPTWTFGYEVITGAQKRFHERVARLDPIAERRAWNSLKGANPSRKQVVWTRSARGGVECTDISPRAGMTANRMILYVHGGAFLYGSETSHGELCSRISLAAEARLVFPRYRLAPEHPFPAALKDTLAVYRALLAEGVHASSVVVAGDSAGGNLALAALVALRDQGAPLPAAGVLICPCVDLTARTGSMKDNEPFDWASAWMAERWQREYLAGENPRDPLASPAFADLSGLPPLLVQIGTAELLYDQACTLAERAREAGVDVTLDEYADRAHLWHALAPMFPEFQASIDRIGRYVAEVAPASRTSGSPQP
jgi:acetyl esterase/lipase